jgi:hypothetical protein
MNAFSKVAAHHEASVTTRFHGVQHDALSRERAIGTSRKRGKNAAQSLASVGMGGRHHAGRRRGHPGLGSNAHYSVCGRTAGAVAGQTDVTCPNDVDEGALFSACGFF